MGAMKPEEGKLQKKKSYILERRAILYGLMKEARVPISGTPDSDNLMTYGSFYLMHKNPHFKNTWIHAQRYLNIQ